MKKPIITRTKVRIKIKEYLFRARFKKVEKIKWILKIILTTKRIQKQFKVLAVFLLINLLNKSSITKQKNICLLSSWKRSVNLSVKLNRLTFMDKSSKLFLPGILNSNK